MIYGFVLGSAELMAAVKARRAIVRGCFHESTDPRWKCNACRKGWGGEDPIVAKQKLDDHYAREAEKAQQRLAEADARGVLDATLSASGFARCPVCKLSFPTRSPQSWRDGRHQSCLTRLRLVPAPA